MTLFTYFDCESDAGAAQKATCLSVSAVTVDENFKETERWTLNSRFRKSRAFEVDAMLAHNIPIKTIQSANLSNGELIDDSFQFNSIEFCKKYNFSTSKVNTCLKILSNQGILNIHTDFNKKSNLQLITTSKQLINFTKKSHKLYQLISTIMRSYSGLFEQETINNNKGRILKNIITF